MLAGIAPGTGAHAMVVALEHDAKWQPRPEPITGDVHIEVEILEEARKAAAAAARVPSTRQSFQHALDIRVLRAEGLVAKDKGGTSDPFVELRLEGQTFKTKVQPRTLDPEWDEHFQMEADIAGATLELVVYDHDKGFLGSSAEYLGSVAIPLQLYASVNLYIYIYVYIYTYIYI